MKMNTVKTVETQTRIRKKKKTESVLSPFLVGKTKLNTSTKKFYKNYFKQMNTKNVKPILLAVLVLTSTSIFAQSFGLEEKASNFWNELKGSAKYIIAAIFLASILFNIGKITGGDRDYKGFFGGVAMFVGGLALVGGIITYILGLNF